MIATPPPLRQKWSESANGFTMLELVMVMAVMGILMAIAIPVYSNYTKGANDSAALSDLRNAIVVVERCNTDQGTYPTPVTTSGSSTLPPNPTNYPAQKPLVGYIPCSGQSVNISNGTTMDYWTNSSASPYTSYLMTATNSTGTGTVYCYASFSGAAPKQATTPISAYNTACPS